MKSLSGHNETLTETQKEIVALAIDLFVSEDNAGEWKTKRGPLAEASIRLTGKFGYESSDMSRINYVYRQCFGNGYGRSETPEEYVANYRALLA